MRKLTLLTSLCLVLACGGAGPDDDGGGLFGNGDDDGGGGLFSRDDDDDGYNEDEDCDDGDASVNPGQQEVPYDGVDNDCDAATPDDDLDGDGFGIDQDCDDDNASVNPDQVEVPGDGLDNDCDSSTCLNPGFAGSASSWALPKGYGQDHFTAIANSGYCSSGYNIPSYTTMDLSGDGLPEMLVSYHCGDGTLGDSTWAVHENKGSGFVDSATSWSLPSGYGAEHFTTTANSGYCSSGYNIPTYTTMDLTGDALPDLVVSYHCGNGTLGDTTWAVHENTGGRFAASPTSWSMPTGYGAEHFTTTANNGYCSSGYDIPSYTTMDITGDGRPDLVVTYHCGDGSIGDTTWAVHENTGSGFAKNATSWALPTGYGADLFTTTSNSGYCSSGYNIPSYTTMDITGDGRPDLVVTYHCGDGSIGDSTWVVHKNTGSGFAAATTWSLPSGYGTDNLTNTANSGYCSSGYDIPSYSTLDITGDGRPDLLVTYHCGDGTLGDTTWGVHENTGSGFASSATAWTMPPGYGADQFTATTNSGYCSSGYDIPSYTTMDLVGDERLDLVVSYHCGKGTLGDTTWAVHKGTCDL